MLRMCVLNISRLFFLVLLLAGFITNSFAELSPEQAQQLSAIANDVNMMEGYFQNIDNNLNEEYFTNVSDSLSNINYSFDDLKYQTQDIYYLLNEDISSKLYNIDDNSFRSYNELTQIREFLNSQYDFESLEELLQALSADEITILNQISGEMGGIYSAIGGVSEAINNINIDISADLEPIITNQLNLIDYTVDILGYTSSTSTNVEYIANYIATNKVDIQNPISESVSEAQSQYSLDTAETFYTNKITRTVDLDPEDAPGFEQYTNVASVVQSLAESYEIQQFSSTTNQLFTSLNSLKDGVTDYLDSFKKSDFFNTEYNTKVVLIRKGSITDRPDFGFEFDFADMNLPKSVTTFLTRIYDAIYAIFCIWALVDIFKWCVDKYGD